MRPPALVSPRSVPGLFAISLIALAGAVYESEPNDTLTQAQVVSLGDTVEATMPSAADVDWYAFDIGSETVVEIGLKRSATAPVDFEPVVLLTDRDSVGVLANLPAPGADGLRFAFTLPGSGRYFARISALQGADAGDAAYTLDIVPFVGDETEPNDTPQDATPIALRDTVLGALEAPAAVDYFSLELDGPLLLHAGTFNMPGVDFGARVRLFDPDGVTRLSHEEWFGAPPALEAFIPGPGRYYLSITDAYSTAPGNRLYGLLTNTEATGSGDPTSLRMTGLAVPTRVFAGARGEFYVVEPGTGTLRVNPDNSVDTVLEGIASGTMLGIEGHGDLLIGALDPPGVVWRVARDGTRSEFTRVTGGTPSVAAIGPDGSVWFADFLTLNRFDPLGRLVETMSVPPGGPIPQRLAFAPSGELYFSSQGSGGYGLYRFAAGNPQLVYSQPTPIVDLAFDREGHLYLLTQSSVVLLSATGEVLERPLARTGLGGALSLAFGRTATGDMTGDLVVGVTYYGGPRGPGGALVHVHPNGVRAAGHRVGFDLYHIDRTLIPSQVVGRPVRDSLRIFETGEAVAWSVLDGALPTGLGLDEASGLVSGVPVAAGRFVGTIRASGATRYDLIAFDVQVRTPDVAPSAAIDGLLGSDAELSTDERRYLDIQGNANGRYDVGDLRAFLQARGVLPSAARSHRPGERTR